MSTLREEFEKWARKEGYSTKFVEGAICVSGGPVYEDSRTHAAWWAFQAGRLQGLGEASAKVRAILADCEEQDIDDPGLESIAQDIDQLKDRT